mmetsp:Transcript_67836/g.172200  ORF Transcript_67836/g.172200 Transcript_67836/m.172200 type:complete len:340 (-) Transcript_67836:1282-2301(-)
MFWNIDTWPPLGGPTMSKTLVIGDEATGTPRSCGLNSCACGMDTTEVAGVALTAAPQTLPELGGKAASGCGGIGMLAKLGIPCPVYFIDPSGTMEAVDDIGEAASGTEAEPPTGACADAGPEGSALLEGESREGEATDEATGDVASPSDGGSRMDLIGSGAAGLGVAVPRTKAGGTSACEALVLATAAAAIAAAVVAACGTGAIDVKSIPSGGAGNVVVGGRFRRRGAKAAGGAALFMACSHSCRLTRPSLFLSMDAKSASEGDGESKGSISGLPETSDNETACDAASLSTLGGSVGKPKESSTSPLSEPACAKEAPRLRNACRLSLSNFFSACVLSWW